MSQDEPRPATERLLSIDALRGFDMFWIMGGGELVAAIANRIGGRWSSAVETQLEHVEWEGFRFEDLIFPLFLFLVGCVIPFSLEKLARAGTPRSVIYGRIVRRTLLLFGLGLLANGVLDFDWPHLRVAGVLQRIAICYGAAAIITINTGTRSRLFLLLTILLGYWALLEFVPAPGSSPGDFSKTGNLAGYVDRHYLPGRIVAAYYGYGDNEGLLSTIPAIATALIGVLAGTWLRSSARPWRKVLGLVVAGLLCVVTGAAWSYRFPIIKNIWTSSFVLVAGGCSLFLLALFYALIDVLKWRRWAFFFIVIGANAIIIYVAPNFLDFSRISSFFLGGATRLSGGYGPIVAAAGVLAVKWLFLYYLYRNRLYLRV